MITYHRLLVLALHLINKFVMQQNNLTINLEEIHFHVTGSKLVRKKAKSRCFQNKLATARVPPLDCTVQPKYNYGHQKTSFCIHKLDTSCKSLVLLCGRILKLQELLCANILAQRSITRLYSPRCKARSFIFFQHWYLQYCKKS